MTSLGVSNHCRGITCLGLLTIPHNALQLRGFVRFGCGVDLLWRGADKIPLCPIAQDGQCHGRAWTVSRDLARVITRVGNALAIDEEEGIADKKAITQRGSVSLGLAISAPLQFVHIQARRNILCHVLDVCVKPAALHSAGFLLLRLRRSLFGLRRIIAFLNIRVGGGAAGKTSRTKFRPFAFL